jgi:hypothetical protein
MVEAKCPYWKKQVHFEVPLYYYMQMNLCLECANREWCDYISWTPEAYKISRVTRDRDLHDYVLPHYSNFFAAMSRGADGPPVMRKGDLKIIRERVEASVRNHVDLEFWGNVDCTAPPPTPEQGEEDDFQEVSLNDNAPTVSSPRTVMVSVLLPPCSNEGDVQVV